MKWVEWVSYELEQKADIDEVKLMQQLIQAEFLQTFINLYAHSTLNVSTVNCLRSTGLLFLLFFDNSIIIIMSSEWHESSRSKTLRAREPKHHKNLWKCEKRWVEFVRFVQWHTKFRAVRARTANCAYLSTKHSFCFATVTTSSPPAQFWCSMSCCDREKVNWGFPNETKGEYCDDDGAWEAEESLTTTKYHLGTFARLSRSLSK